MAASKTTAAQVLSQLAAGATVGGIVWYSIRSWNTAVDSPLQSSQTNQIDANDHIKAEIAANTTGKVWGIQSEQSSSQDRTQRS